MRLSALPVLVLVLVLVLVSVLASSCDRLVSNFGGAPGPESGILRGKIPQSSHATTHVTRLTDGIAAKLGDPLRTDLTAALTAPDAFVIWDLGAETEVRCALIDADGDDRYALSLSSDGATFAPLWTAERDEDPGQQLRAGRDLEGRGRYLKMTASGGDGRWAVSEVSAWSECPKAWPPLAMQAGTPDVQSLRLKVYALALLGLAYVLLYRRRAPDWLKLLGAAPAGVAVALVVQLAETWPPPKEIAIRLAGVVFGLGMGIAIRVLVARGRKGAATPPATPED